MKDLFAVVHLYKFDHPIYQDNTYPIASYSSEYDVIKFHKSINVSEHYSALLDIYNKRKLGDRNNPLTPEDQVFNHGLIDEFKEPMAALEDIEETKEDIPVIHYYCNSISWDGQTATRDNSGNGSKRHPYRNLEYALEELLCMAAASCYKFVPVLHLSGVCDYSVYVSDSYIYNGSYVIIDGTQADGSKMYIKCGLDIFNASDVTIYNCHIDIADRDSDISMYGVSCANVVDCHIVNSRLLRVHNNAVNSTFEGIRDNSITIHGSTIGCTFNNCGSVYINNACIRSIFNNCNVAVYSLMVACSVQSGGIGGFSSGSPPFVYGCTITNCHTVDATVIANSAVSPGGISVMTYAYNCKIDISHSYPEDDYACDLYLGYADDIEICGTIKRFLLNSDYMSNVTCNNFTVSELEIDTQYLIENSVFNINYKSTDYRYDGSYHWYNYASGELRIRRSSAVGFKNVSLTFDVKQDVSVFEFDVPDDLGNTSNLKIRGNIDVASGVTSSSDKETPITCSTYTYSHIYVTGEYRDDIDVSYNIKQTKLSNECDIYIERTNFTLNDYYTCGLKGMAMHEYVRTRDNSEDCVIQQRNIKTYEYPDGVTCKYSITDYTYNAETQGYDTTTESETFNIC